MFLVCRICNSFFKASAFSVRKERCKFEAFSLPDFLKIQTNMFHLFSYSNMGKRCVVKFCGNSNKTGHSMHMSPRDLNLRRQWTKFVQVKRAEFVDPSKHSVISGAHFTTTASRATICEKWVLKC